MFENNPKIQTKVTPQTSLKLSSLTLSGVPSAEELLAKAQFEKIQQLADQFKQQNPVAA